MLQENLNHGLALQMHKLEAYLQQQSYFGPARQRERHVMEETDKPTNVFIAAALARVYGRAVPEEKHRHETQRLYARWLVLQQARLDVSNEMVLQRSAWKWTRIFLTRLSTTSAGGTLLPGCNRLKPGSPSRIARITLQARMTGYELLTILHPSYLWDANRS
jgi:hypothetical protein